MAIDTTAKAANLAIRIMNGSSALMDAVRDLIALKEEQERGGINFAPDGVPMDFSNSSILKHINGENINLVISSAGALKTWLDDNHHSDNFDKVRP